MVESKEGMYEIRWSEIIASYSKFSNSAFQGSCVALIKRSCGACSVCALFGMQTGSVGVSSKPSILLFSRKKRGSGGAERELRFKRRGGKYGAGLEATKHEAKERPFCSMLWTSWKSYCPPLSRQRDTEET